MGKSFEAVLGMGVVCAVLLSIGVRAEAQAIVVSDPFINEAGDLEVEFSQRTLPRAEVLYRARALVDMTAVCVDGLARPLRGQRYRQTIHVVVERSLPLLADFSGHVFGFVTLYAPRDEVTLACPGGSIPKLAWVRYGDIEVRNQIGEAARARSTSRTFVR